MNITKNEKSLINAIVYSDYNDGHGGVDPHKDIQVWLPTPEECGFSSKKTMSGVVSSLVQKGLIWTEGEGNDITTGLTPQGEDFYIQNMAKKEQQSQPITKVIEGYTRYIMDDKGRVLNATTGSELKKENKGGAMHVRLTSDKGQRDWLNAEKLYNDLFNIDVEGKTKASAKPKNPAKLSKSQRIWLLYKAEGKTIKEIVESDSTFNEGHIRNVIKDYTQNTAKQEQAAKINKMVEQESAKS